MATVDSLDIQISAEVKKANASIDLLVKRLDRLSASLSGVNARGLATLGSGVNKLSNAMNNFSKNTKISDFTKLTSSLKKLNDINVTSINAVSPAIERIAKSMDSIGSLNFGNNSKQVASMVKSLGSLNKINDTSIKNATDAIGKIAGAMNGIKSMNFGDNSTKISELARSISNLGGKSATTAISNIPKLADAMKKFMQTLSTAPKVSQNLIDMTNAMAKFARTGSSGGRAAVSLGNNISNMAKKLMSAPKSINMFNKSITTSVFSMNKLKGSISSFLGMFGGIYAVFNGLKESVNISSDLTEVQNVVDTAFGDYAKKVNEFANTSLFKFGLSELDAKTIAGRFQAMGIAIGIPQKEMTNMSIELSKLSGDLASFYNMSSSETARSLWSVFTGETEPLRKYGADITQATLQEWAMKKGIDANIQSMSQKEKTLLRYKYVLEATKVAQGDFIRTSNSWHNQISILKGNFKNLGKEIGNVLTNALKPFVKALNLAMLEVVEFAKEISNALGKIFGWTYEEGGGSANPADDMASSMGDLSDATENATKKQKELNRQLGKFDELNNYSKPSDSSGDNGGSANLGITSSDGGSGGKWKQGKSMIKSFESEIDTLYKLGKKIGDTLKGAMDSINWDSIYKKAENFGTGLATFLNGLISPELFSSLGTTVAKSVNTAIRSALSFGKNFDFSNLGESIGSFINSSLYGIDWVKALDAVKTWGKGIAESINSFIKETDFEVVGESIANFLSLQIQGALSLGSDIDFEEIGKKISTAINSFFSTFSFSDLAETLNVWVQGIYTTVKTALSNIEWSNVYNALKDFLENIDIKTIGIVLGAISVKKVLATKIAGSALSSVGSVLSKKIASSIATSLGVEIAANAGIGTALLAAGKSIGVTFIAGFKALLGSEAAASALVFTNGIIKGITGIGSVIGGVSLAVTNFISMFKNGFEPIKEVLMVVGTALAAIGAVILGVPAGIAAAVAAAVAAIGTAVVLIKDNWGSIKDFFSNTWDSIKKIWENVSTWFSDNVGKPISNAFKTVTTNVGGFFSGLWGGIKSIWTNVSTWFSDNVIEPVVSLFKGVKTRVGQFFEGLWIIIKAVWKVSSTWFSEKVAEPIKGVFKALKEKISTFFKNLWNAIKAVWNIASTWFGEKVATPIKNTFLEVKNKVGNFFKDSWNAIKETWKNASTWFSEKVTTPIRKTFKTVTEKVGGFFDTLWKGIKNGVGSAFNFVVEGIETAINGIVKGINGIIGGFNKIVTVAAEVVGADWSGVDKLSKVTLPRIKVETYATGGFPEDGWFRASKGEYFGQFDDGTSYIANNRQIENGIAVEVGGAVRNANAEQNALLREQNELLRQILAKNTGITSGEVFSAVRKEASNYKKRTGMGAFAY